MEEMGAGQEARSCVVGKTEKGPAIDPGACPAGCREAGGGRGLARPEHRPAGSSLGFTFKTEL